MLMPVREPRGRARLSTVTSEHFGNESKVNYTLDPQVYNQPEVSRRSEGIDQYRNTYHTSMLALLRYAEHRSSEPIACSTFETLEDSSRTGFALEFCRLSKIPPKSRLNS